jgi:hypothetical protein
MPKAASLDSVKRWKEQELTHPIISFVFEKLRLSQIVGRTGSVRARFVVIGVFLLVLLIPLQSALNELTMELRVRQAITEVSRAFDVEYRSTIINTSSRLKEDLIEVKLQVATNSYFTSEDITRFEERIADRTGITTRLDLVQTLSNIGESATTRGMLSSETEGTRQTGPSSFADAMGALRFQSQTILRSLPLSKRLEIISLNAELTQDTLSPALNFVYLAEKPITEDVLDILSTLIAGHVSMPVSSIQFSWVNLRHGFDLDSSPIFSPADLVRLNNLQSQLRKFPQLALTVQMPEVSIGEYQPELFASKLAAVLPIAADTVRVTYVPTPELRDSLFLRLRVVGNITPQKRTPSDASTPSPPIKKPAP